MLLFRWPLNHTSISEIVRIILSLIVYRCRIYQRNKCLLVYLCIYLVYRAWSWRYFTLPICSIDRLLCDRLIVRFSWVVFSISTNLHMYWFYKQYNNFSTLVLLSVYSRIYPIKPKSDSLTRLNFSSIMPSSEFLRSMNSLISPVKFVVGYYSGCAYNYKIRLTLIMEADMFRVVLLSIVCGILAINTEIIGERCLKCSGIVSIME